MDHAGSDGHGHRADPAGPDGDTAGATQACKGGPGNGDSSNKAQRWPTHARVGLGSDGFASEYSITGEELDDRKRASMLDESLKILAAAWSGEPVHHRGEHYTVDGMRFLPRPVQRPGVPWGGGLLRQTQAGAPGGEARVSPLGLDHPEQLAEIVARLAALRREAGRDPTEPYDVVVALPPGDDPAPYAAAGATWWLVEFPWDAPSIDQVRAVIRDGPAAPA